MKWKLEIFFPNVRAAVQKSEKLEKECEEFAKFADVFDSFSEVELSAKIVQYCGFQNEITLLRGYAKALEDTNSDSLAIEDYCCCIRDNVSNAESKISFFKNERLPIEIKHQDFAMKYPLFERIFGFADMKKPDPSCRKFSYLASNTNRRYKEIVASHFYLCITEIKKEAALVSQLSFCNSAYKNQYGNDIDLAYKKNSDELAFMLSNLLPYFQSLAKERGYKNVVDYKVSSLGADIDYKKMMELCSANYQTISHSFYNRQAKNSTSRFSYWNKDSAPDSEKNIDFSSEAMKNKILESFQSISFSIANRASTLFDDGHIDASPAFNKVTGHYCLNMSTDYDPLILVNYWDNLSSAFTLVDELVSAVQIIFTQKHGHFGTSSDLVLKQGLAMFHERIFAEKLLNSLDEESRSAVEIEIIARRINFSLGQAAICSFELSLYEASEKETYLTSSMIRELWFNSQTAMLGKEVNLMYAENAWGMLGHIFSQPFQSLNSIIAFGIAEELFDAYKKNPAYFCNQYNGMLADSGICTRKDSLKKLGIDFDVQTALSKALSRLQKDVVALES